MKTPKYKIGDLLMVFSGEVNQKTRIGYVCGMKLEAKADKNEYCYLLCGHLNEFYWESTVVQVGMPTFEAGTAPKQENV